MNLPDFHARDTFTIRGRGRVYTGRFAAAPSLTEKDMLGKSVWIVPDCAGIEGLSHSRAFSIAGVERFRPLISNWLEKDESVGLLVRDEADKP